MRSTTVEIEYAEVEQAVDEDGQAVVVFRDVVVRVGVVDARTLVRRASYGGRKGRSALRRLLRLR